MPGGEILYVGDVTAPIVGWTAPGGSYPDADAPPDVVTNLVGLAPDVIRGPTGAYRLYYEATAALELHRSPPVGSRPTGSLAHAPDRAVPG